MGTGGHNVPIVLTDIRGGNNKIHSWDLIKTTKREKKICQSILLARRSKIKDGHFIDFNRVKKDIPDLKDSDLKGLINKGILMKKGNLVNFKNARANAGINSIYRIIDENSHNFPTMTAQGQSDFISNGNRIRKLTPRECFRLQGFKDSYSFDNLSNSALYRLIGNSVTVPLIERIVRSIWNEKN